MRSVFLTAVWFGLQARAAPIDPCSPPRGFDLPLVRDPFFGYLGNVSVGTPSQEITVFVDWTWTSQYFLSTVCGNGTASTGTCLSPGQQIFNQTQSNSFVNQTAQYPDQAWYPNEFLPVPFEVSYGADVMQVGPRTSPITMQLSDIPPGLLVQMPLSFGGIMGLMPTFPNTPVTQQSFFYQQWKANTWAAPYSAFATCDAADCPTGADAIQTFGGYSTELAAKGLTWYPLVSVPTANQIAFVTYPEIYSYWSVGLTSVTIGDEEQALNATAEQELDAVPAAIFNHASQGRGLPLSVDGYARLVELANATAIPLDSPLLQIPPNNGMQPFFQFDCSTVQNLPTISYVFDGSPKVWTVEPDAYVVQAGESCILDVRVLGHGSWELGNFGDNFLRGKYIVFDYDLLRVGLAEL